MRSRTGPGIISTGTVSSAGRGAVPGQGLQLAERARLVALDRDRVVRAAGVQVSGVLALRVQGVLCGPRRYARLAGDAAGNGGVDVHIVGIIRGFRGRR